jgi:hypothetical protein
MPVGVVDAARSASAVTGPSSRGLPQPAKRHHAVHDVTHLGLGSRPHLGVVAPLCTTLININWFGLAVWGEYSYYVPLKWLFRIAHLYAGLVLTAILAYGPLQGVMSFQHSLLVTPTPLHRTDALTVQVTRKRGVGWLLHSIPLGDEKVLRESRTGLSRRESRHLSRIECPGSCSELLGKSRRLNATRTTLRIAYAAIS